MKSNGFGVAVNVPVIPLPVSGTSTVPLSSTSERVALFAPWVVGKNSTVTWQELPPLTVAPPQSWFATLNCDESAPAMVTSETVTSDPPPFVNTTDKF